MAQPILSGPEDRDEEEGDQTQMNAGLEGAREQASGGAAGRLDRAEEVRQEAAGLA